MHWLDILILIFLAYNILCGIKNGFFREIFNLIGIIVGIFLALNYNDLFARKLTLFLKISYKNSLILSFPIIWLISFLIFFVLGKLFHKLTKILLISWVDHIAGGFLGAIKGFIIVTLLFISFLKIPFLNYFEKEIPKTKYSLWIKKIIPSFALEYPYLDKLKNVIK
ncbi:MAG: CvpA family protein [Candidatus Firestonebacteria bacterium]|nr:CvpA family protein [Candidatus Firestonebacteria bacterium]